MRILITNDDGINAPGLVVLSKIAEQIAGSAENVWTVAPAFEQSGVGHCISYTHPTMLAELGPRRFAAEGSPADCVLAGIHHVMKDARPDLILSGVNRGNNAGENAMYSGTIGAAIEGALQGVPAIAMSQFYGPENAHLDDPFDAAARHGAATVQRLLDKGIWDTSDYRLFYNVNFPPIAAGDVKGLRVGRQGYRKGSGFSVQPHEAPSGRSFMWVHGSPQAVETGAGTDVSDNLAGYISVTPMRADLTAHDAIDAVAEQLG